MGLAGRTLVRYRWSIAAIVCGAIVGSQLHRAPFWIDLRPEEPFQRLSVALVALVVIAGGGIVALVRRSRPIAISTMAFAAAVLVTPLALLLFDPTPGSGTGAVDGLPYPQSHWSGAVECTGPKGKVGRVVAGVTEGYGVEVRPPDVYGPDDAQMYVTHPSGSTMALSDEEFSLERLSDDWVRGKATGSYADSHVSTVVTFTWDCRLALH